MVKIIKDLLKGPSNAYWDLGRVLGASGFLSLISAQVYALYLGQAFNVLEFGGAIAAVLTGAGALISLKDNAAAATGATS